MSTIKIAEKPWQNMYKFLKAHPNVYAGQQEACRRFVEGVHWVLRSGAQWRELPEKYGNWNSVYKRFAGWEERGIWAEMHEHFAQDPDMESVILDSTVIRAHMCAAGGSKKTVVKRNNLSDAVAVDSVQRFTSSSMR
jgi:putative transposase